MAFNSLEPTQAVSYTEAATGSFTLKSGQINSGGNQCMTKDMANAIYKLSNTVGAQSIAGHQLMQKSFWESAVQASIPVDFGTGANSLVTVVRIQSDGKILVGGNFTSFNGSNYNRLVRLNSNGSIDTTFVIGTGLNSMPNDIRVQSDGKVLIVGTFSQYNGATVNYLIRLNSNGSLDSTFVTGSGFNNNTPTKLKILSTGNYLIVGNFTTYNGIAANRIICLLPNGSINTSFDYGLGFNDTVIDCYIQSDGKILVGGEFKFYKNISNNYLIRLNSDGSVDSTFVVGTGFDYFVRSIAIQNDGNILVSGRFSTYKGVPVKNLVRLSNIGTLDTTYGSSITSMFGKDGVTTGFNAPNITDIHILPNNQIIATGWFNQFNGLTVPISAAKLNPNGTLDSLFVTYFGSLIRSSDMYEDNKILCGGDFMHYNGTVVNYLVRINENGSIDSSHAVSVTTDNTAPTAPILNSVTINVESNTLTWTSSTDAVGVTQYEIWREEDGNGMIYLDVDTSSPYDDFTNNPIYIYSYQVRSRDAAGNWSAFSNIMSTPANDTIAPSTPTNLSHSQLSSSEINLTWTASTDNVGVAGYQVYRSTTSVNTGYTLVGDTTMTEYYDGAVFSNETYWYKVSAYDAAGNVSAFSIERQVYLFS